LSFKKEKNPLIHLECFFLASRRSVRSPMTERIAGMMNIAPIKREPDGDQGRYTKIADDGET